MREFIKPTDERNLDEEAKMLEIDRAIRKAKFKRSSTGSLYSITSKPKLKFRSTLNKEKSNG
jgi:hypothetical protein